MATLLIGYDTESAAVGEGLARFIGPDVPQYRAALDPDTTRRGVELLQRLHEELEAPARSSSAAERCCTRSTRSSRSRRRRSSTSSSTPTATSSSATSATRRRAREHEAVLPETPHVALREELRLTSELIRKYLGRECIGLRTPFGYYRGLRDRPDLLAIVARHRPQLRHLVGPQRAERQPDAVGRQPFAYAEEGFPDCSRSRSSSGSTGSGSTRTATARAARSAARSRRRGRDRRAGPRLRHRVPRVGRGRGGRGGHGLDPRPDRARARARRRGHELRGLLGARGAGRATLHPRQRTTSARCARRTHRCTSWTVSGSRSSRASSTGRASYGKRWASASRSPPRARCSRPGAGVGVRSDPQARRHARLRAQLRAGHARPVRRSGQRDDLDDHDDLRPARGVRARQARSAAGPRQVVGLLERRQDDHFHLRDAKFSNGAPVTADDVVFSLNRFKDPKVNRPAAVPRHEHRLGYGAGQEDRRDEAEAPRRRDPGEPLGVPGLDHAEGGRDEDGRQGVRAEPGRQRARSSSTTGSAAST